MATLETFDMETYNLARAMVMGMTDIVEPTIGGSDYYAFVVDGDFPFSHHASEKTARVGVLFGNSADESSWQPQYGNLTDFALVRHVSSHAHMAFECNREHPAHRQRAVVYDHLVAAMLAQTGDVWSLMPEAKQIAISEHLGALLTSRTIQKVRKS